jgi:thiol-disulfide isomerase/thioredoxin
MKKIFLIIFTLCPLITWAQNSNFIIKVKINPQPVASYAYYHYEVNGKTVFDSLQAKSGYFEFKGTVSQPVYAQLLLDHSGKGLKGNLNKQPDLLNFYIDKGVISINGVDSVKSATINDAGINKEFENYKGATKVPEDLIEATKTEFNEADSIKKLDTVYVATLRNRITIARKAIDSLKRQYARLNPKSFFSLLTLSQLDTDPEKIEPLFNSLDPVVKAYPMGQELKGQIAAAKITGIGKTAPVFAENDAAGRPFKLTSSRGKYVLLDFWASWCVPCRNANPGIVKVYQQYQNKNFSIIGVSLDYAGKKQAWLDAIKQDGLTWTQLGSQLGFKGAAAKLYGITAIPTNFLIDPNGKIIAKDLDAEALEEKLKQLLGS